MTDFNPRLLPFVYTNKLADQLSKLAYELLPPSSEEDLPVFWMYESPESFVKRFGHLGTVVWCRRNAYHRLLLSGQQVMRFWTTDKYPRAELCEGLTNVLSATGLKGLTRVKSSYYASWIQICNTGEVQTLMSTIKMMYGV